MTSEVSIRKLKKSYRSGTEALKSIDLEIQRGRFFALLGPNGAGKSTLVKILTTLIEPDSGEFLICGLNSKDKLKDIRRYIGVVSQDNELDLSESVQSLLVFQCRLFGMQKKLAVKRSDELIELFDLSSERCKKAGSLSGGNKRRLHCALSMVHYPKLLFLDEPTVGMDPVARFAFWQAICGLNRRENVTVFLTTQYLEEADKYASEMALIIKGETQFAGTLTLFKNMVNRSVSTSFSDERERSTNSEEWQCEKSLEESYIQFVKSFVNN